MSNFLISVEYDSGSGNYYAWNTKFPDTRLYFYEVVSNKCLWCSKFPKAKNERHIK